MVLLLFLWCFWAGLSGALAVRQPILRLPSMRREPYLAGLLLYVACVVVPTMAYALFAQPQWCFRPFLRVNSLPVIWMVAVWTLPWISAVLGFGITLGLIRRRSPVLIGSLAVVTLASMLGLGLFWLQGLTVPIGESREVLAGVRLSLNRLRVFWGFAGPVLLGGWIFLVALYCGEGKKLSRALQRMAPAKDEHP